MGHIEAETVVLPLHPEGRTLMREQWGKKMGPEDHMQAKEPPGGEGLRTRTQNSGGTLNSSGTQSGTGSPLCWGFLGHQGLCPVFGPPPNPSYKPGTNVLTPTAPALSRLAASTDFRTSF